MKPNIIFIDEITDLKRYWTFRLRVGKKLLSKKAKNIALKKIT